MDFSYKYKCCEGKSLGNLEGFKIHCWQMIHVSIPSAVYYGENTNFIFQALQGLGHCLWSIHYTLFRYVASAQMWNLEVRLVNESVVTVNYKGFHISGNNHIPNPLLKLVVLRVVTCMFLEFIKFRLLLCIT
jgi:hypothetical protein